MKSDFPAKWTGDLAKKMHLNKVKNADLAKELGVTEAYISMLMNSKSNTKGAKERLESAFKSVLEKRSTVNGTD